MIVILIKAEHTDHKYVNKSVINTLKVILEQLESCSWLAAILHLYLRKSVFCILYIGP